MNQKLLRKMLLFFVGISIISFGVSLFITTNIGSDPFTVFTQGVRNLLNNFGINATTGGANIVIMVVSFIAVLIFDKSRLKIGTLICVVVVGPVIDFGVSIFSNFDIHTFNYVFKLGFVVLGCFIIAVGFSILSASNLGVGPHDTIPFILQDKLKKEYKVIRMSADATLLIVGFLLKGVVGLGTVISMVCIGPFIQICLPYGQKFVDKIVNDKIDIEVEELS